MPIIVCDVGELTHAHMDKARKRLQHVSDEPLQISPKALPGSLDLTASHGVPVSADRRDWLFPSRVDSISCQYRELWVPVEPRGQSYKFENVQFHLMQHAGGDEPPKEIVAFHWHLKRVTEAERDNYEHRPHLHLRVDSIPPLQRSHFGVTLGVEANAQPSVSYLNGLLDDAARMFAVEVLPRLTSG